MSVERWQRSPLGRRDDATARERRVAAVLLALTGACMFASHLLVWGASTGLAAVGDAAVFVVCLLGVLVAHEAGHSLMARRMGFRLSLPWFLPVPFGVGTLGAIIRVRERPPDRDALLDMGAAGPLAGVSAIVAVLVVRAVIGADPPPSEWVLARPLLFWLVGAPLGHLAAPTPGDPLGFAAWVGCLVTAMNLLPFGQLDGGHVAGALWPKARAPLRGLVTVGLLAAGGWWWGWAVWAAALHVLGAYEPLRARDESERPSSGSRGLAVAAALAWLVCVTPAPWA